MSPQFSNTVSLGGYSSLYYIPDTTFGQKAMVQGVRHVYFSSLTHENYVLPVVLYYQTDVSYIVFSFLYVDGVKGSPTQLNPSAASSPLVFKSFL